MASLRQLFPSYNPQVKTQRNFIKENIRNAKRCNQCIAEKEQSNIKNDTIARTEKAQRARSIKFKSENDLRVPVIKCSMTLVNRTSSSTLSRKGEQRNSHDERKNKNNPRKLESSVKCQSCGQLVTTNRETTSNGELAHAVQNNDRNAVDVIQNKPYRYHKLSHAKEDNCKKNPPNKSLDLSSYKKGEVPRYLQERIAKLMKEEEERKENKELAEKLGLNDPRCPPGHMLMPPEQYKENLATFCNKYELLISELNTMPITKDSFRIKNRKIEIEKELKELEDKILLYKSRKVFVRIPT